MKRITVLTVLLLLVVFAMPTYSQPPGQAPRNVNVVNDPTVHVSTMPDVKVANTASNPIPIEGSVDVTNQVAVTGDVEISNTGLNPVPVVPPLPEPVQFHHFEQFDCDQCDIWHRFPIELDKTLLVEHISIACSPHGTLGAMAIGRTTVPGRTYAALWLNFEETGLVRYRDHAYATHAVTYYVHGGDELEFRIMADSTENGVCTIGVVGRYIDVAP